MNRIRRKALQEISDRIEAIMVGFPAILKPSDAQGQRGIFLLHSQEEFESHFEQARQFSREGKVIVEQYIDGPEVSVNGYMVNGVLRFVVASDRDTWPEYTGLIHRHIVPGREFSRETEQLVTPGTLFTAFSTRAWHAAQLIPVT